MKMQKIIMLSLFLFSTGMAMAQANLKIEKIFDTYGKQQGAILIELSTDVLGGNTKMDFYKSMIISSNDQLISSTMTAIRADIEGGTKMIESVKDGEVETGYYCLKQDLHSKTYEYILYKNKSKKMTLIYIRGKFPPQQLEEELDKLKDLFIYVNKKRIKLQ